MTTLTVVPAYGRDYTSRAAALADWRGGKDFQVAGLSRGYISVRDTEPGMTIRIRYQRQTKVVIVEPATS